MENHILPNEQSNVMSSLLKHGPESVVMGEHFVISLEESLIYEVIIFLL